MKFLQQVGTRLFYVILLLAGLAWMWVSAIPVDATSSGKIAAPQAGFLAPDFSLKSLSGENVSLASLRGKAVLVNIWASWCPPCRAEMPAMERAYLAYKNKGFVVLAVNSTVQDSTDNARAFASERNLSFPILLDESGLVTRLYRIQSLPSSFFIRPDGVISEVVIGGPIAEALLVSRIEKLLEVKP